MKQKHLIAAIILAVIVFLTAVFFIVLRRRATVSPVTELQVESDTAVSRIAWEDPAGFKFFYPANILIDPHDEDEENYAHLELTSADYPGKILIWVKPTKETDIESWLADEMNEGMRSLDSQLAGRLAKKIGYSDSPKLVTAAVDVDALVLLELLPDEKGYWQRVYDEILSSFEFIPLEGEESVPAVGGGAGGAIIEEPEEVIE